MLSTIHVTDTFRFLRCAYTASGTNRLRARRRTPNNPSRPPPTRRTVAGSGVDVTEMSSIIGRPAVGRIISTRSMFAQSNVYWSIVVLLGMIDVWYVIWPFSDAQMSIGPVAPTSERNMLLSVNGSPGRSNQIDWSSDVVALVVPLEGLQ